MAHYAKVISGIVQTVIVADQEFINSGLVGEPTQWVQTSYNTRGGVHYEPNSNTPSADQSKALRKNYAGIGYTYDAERDAFYMPQPFGSWVLNESTCIWEAPVEYPTVTTFEKDGVTKNMPINWDEENIRWVNHQSEYWDNATLSWVSFI